MKTNGHIASNCLRGMLRWLAMPLAIFVFLASCMLQVHHHSKNGRVCVCAIEIHGNCHDAYPDKSDDCDGKCSHHTEGTSQCPQISVWEQSSSSAGSHILSPSSLAILPFFSYNYALYLPEDGFIMFPPYSGIPIRPEITHLQLRAPPVAPTV